MTRRTVSIHASMFESGEADLEFQVDESEDFSVAVWAEYVRVTGKPVYYSVDAELWTIKDSTSPEWSITMTAEEGIATGRLYELCGDDLAAVPARVSVHRGGIGDAGWLPGAWQLIEEIATALTMYAGARKGLNLARTTTNRAAVKEWHRTGEMSMVLEQQVRAQREWHDKNFQREFGVNAGDAGKILRAFGYSIANGSDIWIETDPDKRPWDWSM